jgi:hypothetical protein
MNSRLLQSVLANSMSKMFKKYLSITTFIFAFVMATLFTAGGASAQTMLNECGGLPPGGGPVCSGQNTNGCCGQNGSRLCTGTSCSRPQNSDGSWGRVDKWHCNTNTADCRQTFVGSTNGVPDGQAASLDISGFSCGTVQLDVYHNRFGDDLDDFIVVNIGPDCQGGPGPTSPPGPTTPVGGDRICGQSCSSTSDCRSVPGKAVACVNGTCHNTACSGASVGAGCDCVDSFNRLCGQTCGNGSLCTTNSNGIASACTFISGPVCTVGGTYALCAPRLAAGDEYGNLFDANKLGAWAVCSTDAGALYLTQGSTLASMSEADRTRRMCEWCGNGVIDQGNNSSGVPIEQCDNGSLNGNAGNPCSQTCTLAASPTPTPVSCGGACSNNAQCAANHTCSSAGRCEIALCAQPGVFCGNDPANECGVICPSVTMSNPTAGVGGSTTFSCTTVPGATSYSFRVHLPNSTFVDVAGVGSTSTSQPYTITMPGHHDVQCRYCNGATCSSFQTT